MTHRRAAQNVIFDAYPRLERDACPNHLPQKIIYSVSNSHTLVLKHGVFLSLEVISGERQVVAGCLSDLTTH